LFPVAVYSSAPALTEADRGDHCVIIDATINACQFGSPVAQGSCSVGCGKLGPRRRFSVNEKMDIAIDIHAIWQDQGSNSLSRRFHWYLAHQWAHVFSIDGFVNVRF